jgi:hypothetical protein
LNPIARFVLTLTALVLATTVGFAHWPRLIGLVSTLIALLLLLPLTLGATWSTEPLHVLVGGLIAGAIFLGFGIKLVQVLWSRKHDETIPWRGVRFRYRGRIVL